MEWLHDKQKELNYGDGGVVVLKLGDEMIFNYTGLNNLYNTEFYQWAILKDGKTSEFATIPEMEAEG